MAERITRKMVEDQVKWLNGQTGKDYELSIWAPGNGWTRYQLVLEGGGRTRSRVCKMGEMYEVLYTLNEVLMDLK